MHEETVPEQVCRDCGEPDEYCDCRDFCAGCNEPTLYCCCPNRQ